jgi:hypothetical protein
MQLLSVRVFQSILRRVWLRMMRVVIGISRWQILGAIKKAARDAKRANKKQRIHVHTPDTGMSPMSDWLPYSLRQ